MAKGQKSSASSATRKKHAKKTAGPSDGPPPGAHPPKTKPTGKKGKKEPKVKVFIPPPKFQPLQPDPLDTLGLVHSLPAELVVVLRRLGKKDATTRGRALAELGEWISRAGKASELDGGEEGGHGSEEALEGLRVALPVWYHHLPALLTHPSRPLRLQALQTHSALLASPLREPALAYIRDTLIEEEQERVLGSWAILVGEGDRAVGGVGRASWEGTVAWADLAAQEKGKGKLLFTSTVLAPQLLAFLSKTLHSPLDTFLFLHPPSAPSQPPPPVRGGKAPSSRRVEEPPRRAEEELELEEERVGRLRTGALGALAWVLDTYPQPTPSPTLPPGGEELLLSPLFWSHLSPSSHPPWLAPSTEGFGHNQLPARRAAWGLVKVLVGKWAHLLKEGEAGLGEVISAPVLRSAWVELEGAVRGAMWEPVLSFLTKFPKAWEVEARSKLVVDDEVGEEQEEEDEEDEDDDEDAETVAPPGPSTSTPAPSSSPVAIPSPAIQSAAYAEFLSFLSLACRGSPTSGYPTILVILSTLPPSLLSLSQASLLELFRAFRAVSDDHILPFSDIPAWRAFLSSLLESLVYLSGKAWHANPAIYPQASKEGVQYVIAQEFERLASLLLETPSLLSDADISRTVARTLVRLAAVDQEKKLHSTAWVPLTNKLARVHTPGVAKALSVVHTAVHGTACESLLREFVLQYGGGVLAAVDWSGTGQEAGGLDALQAMLQYFGTLLFGDIAFEQTLTAMLHEHLALLISPPEAGSFSPRVVASLLVQYLTHARTEEAEDLWTSVLSEIGRPQEGTLKGREVLEELAGAVQQGRVVRPLHPRGGELQGLVDQLLQPSAMSGDAHGEGLLSMLLRSHERFVDEATTSNLMSILSSRSAEFVHHSLRSTSVHSALQHYLRIIHSIPASLIASAGIDLIKSSTPTLFLAAYIVPCCHADPTVSTLAQSVLQQWLASLAQEQRGGLLSDVRNAVQACMEDVAVVADPAWVVDAYTQNVSVLGPVAQPSDLILPAMISKQLDALLSTRFDPVLSALDFLVPAMLSGSAHPSKTHDVDTRGFSIFARVAEALLQSLTGGQSVALPPESYWAIHSLLALSAFASDFIAEPGLDNAVFGSSTSIDRLKPLVHLIDLVIRHTFSSSVGDIPSPWHQSTIAHLRKPATTPDATTDPLTAVLADIYHNSIQDHSVLAARTLQRLVGQIARRSAVADLERWLALAQSLEDKHPFSAMAIVLAIKDTLAESPRLNRYQNELASRLSGVPPARADSHGLPLLRLLIASAPSPDSFGTFIPQQRTVFLVQALQKWILSDEELDEEIDRRLGELFDVLAPTILDVPGAHWDFIFELLETNLEASTADGVDLPLLQGSLRLLSTIRDLAIASSSLRESWSEHETQSMQLVRHLFLSGQDVDPRSELQRDCRDRVIALVQELPPSLIDEATILAMYGRLSDPSLEVQKTAYHLLQAAIPKITEQRVIEAAVTTTGDAEGEDRVPQPLFNLPSELISFLLEPLEVIDDDDIVTAGTFGRLLGWMVLFDFFVDASPALKANYVEQLRSGDLLGRSLFDAIIPLLPVLRRGRPLNVALWNVEEFYVELFDDTDSKAVSVLAAHLFYRVLSTIPSLARTWWLDIKDRQLSSAVATFASTHFSPIIVSAEFAKLKQPQAEEELAHENLSLKVATIVSEVTVAYTIDEQQMELGIRLPPDFPLHGVEVRDIKRVGVPVEKWRQWMLQVQQTITSQNGFLLDALVLFKKNVTLYFEGVVECAICYSVISTTDRSLPTKPCKTCKNLFHNSCLYKWFNTSNQSSCPLCRSQF